MARVRTNFITGFVDNNPLAIGGTTLNSTALSGLAVVSNPDTAIIVLDPEARYGAPEIVVVTAHTSSATSATITRGQEGTTARSHVQGTRWIHAPVKLDWDHGNLDGLTDDDHTIYTLVTGARAVTGEQNHTRAGTTDKSITIKLAAGDTTNRFEILADGKHQWGAGGASAVDTNLYRSAADTLKTDDNFSAAGGTIFIGADCSIYRSGADALQTDDAFRVANTFRADGKATIAVATGTSAALGLKASADGTDRFGADGSGKMTWGDGINPVDTNLYRSGVDTLKTDDTFVTTRLDVLPGANLNTYAYVPVGLVSPFAGSSAPNGWLLCYGQAVNRVTYAALWSLLGGTYGNGDGVNTFNLPDLRGRVIAGLDNMGGSAASRLTSTTMSPNGTTLGATGGTQTHTLSSGEMPSHSHSITDPGHDHDTGQGITIAGGLIAFASGGQNFSTISSTETTGITINNTGGGGAHLNIQPTMVMNYIIKH